MTFIARVAETGNTSRIPGFGNDNTLAEYRLRDGSLGVVRPVQVASADQSFNFSITVPSVALATKHRNLDSVVQVIAGNQLLEQSEPFRVSFPKP